MAYTDPQAKLDYNRRYYHDRIARDPERYRQRLALQNERRRAHSRGERFAANANHRALRYGLPDRLRADAVAALPVGPCAYCGGEQDTWDHVVPLGRGGPNVVANLVPTCHPCNQRKNLRTPEEWTA